MHGSHHLLQFQVDPVKEIRDPPAKDQAQDKHDADAARDDSCAGIAPGIDLLPDHKGSNHARRPSHHGEKQERSFMSRPNASDLLPLTN